MKELELLTILTDVKSEYIQQAQQLRSGQRKGASRTGRKRMLLLAAIISLMLLLVGCAVVIASLQRVYMGRRGFSSAIWQQGETFYKDVLSLGPEVDSPVFRANQAWMDFESGYDKDGALLKQADAAGYETPPDYFSYPCYTPQMCQEIDRICQEYGLELAGPMYFPEEAAQTLEAVQVPSIASGQGELELSAGRFFRSGSFRLDGSIYQRFSDRQEMQEVSFEYLCSKKDVLLLNSFTTDQVGSFDVWAYTAPDGTALTLAQNKERGLILGQNQDFYVTVLLHFSLGELIDVDNPCLRQDMEQIADAFCYDIQPQPPEVQWLQYPNLVQSQLDDYSSNFYEEHFRQWLPGSVGSEAYSPDYQQKFLDLDGDIWDEMLIYNARTGVIYQVVTKVDGQVTCVYGEGFWEDSRRQTALYLCQDGLLEKDCGGIQGAQSYEYYRLENHQLVLVEAILEGSDGKYYWSESGGASAGMWREISREEYESIRAGYVRQDVPKTWDQPEEPALMAVLKNERPFCVDGQQTTLGNYCAQEGQRMGFDVAVKRYAFVDMDADGAQELIVDFRFGQNDTVMCLVLKEDLDSVYAQPFYYRQMYQIREDGTFRYSGGGTDDGWGTLQWTGSGWETIPAEDSEGKPELTWYRAT